MEQQERTPQARLRAEFPAGSAIALRPRTERTLVPVYLLLACLTLAHAVYLSYGSYFAETTSKHGALTQQEYYSLHNTIALTAEHPLFHGEDHAPNQYRVGVEYAGKFVAGLVGISKLYIVFSVFDFFCAFGTGWLSYLLLVRSEFFAALSDSAKTLAVVTLLAALAYPFAWAVPWERPETLPSALYLVAALAILDRVREGRRWLAALAAATVWQGFVRTDIPAVLGLALMVLGLVSATNAKRLFGSRGVCFGAGTMVLGIAVAIQIYLQVVLFPHAAYPPDTAVIQAAANLRTRPSIAFAIATIPWAIVTGLAVRLRRRLDPLDWVAAIASCLYLPLWWTFGVIGEARLFVPFLAGMVVVMAKLVVSLLSPLREEAV